MPSADYLAAFRRDGFLIARTVLAGGEIDVLHAEWARLWREAEADLDRPGVFWREHDALGRVADRLDPVYPISNAFASVADDARMRALAELAIGAPCVFFKDKLIGKPPGTHGYALHHDYAYWEDLGVGPDEIVTVLVALDPTDETNGGVELFPGLHAVALPRHPLDPLDLDVAGIEGAESCVPRLAAGDALIFHSRIPHRSAPNRSAGSRRVYVVTYMDARHAGRVRPPDAERRKALYRSLARESI